MAVSERLANGCIVTERIQTAALITCRPVLLPDCESEFVNLAQLQALVLACLQKSLPFELKLTREPNLGFREPDLNFTNGHSLQMGRNIYEQNPLPDQQSPAKPCCNVLGLVPDRGRVTDHPRRASYFSK